MQPVFLATERMKWHITCPNKAVMKAKAKYHTYYREVCGECIQSYNDAFWKCVNPGQDPIPKCLYLFIHTKEYSKGIKKAKAKLYMDRWMKWSTPIGNKMKMKLIMDHHLKKNKRWQHMIAIVISIAKMKTKQCIDEAGADDANDATTLWNQCIHDRK